jgi:hypothetical protein
MTDKRDWIPVARLAATIAVAAFMVVQLSAQTRTDFSNASLAEVRDAQGLAVLSGQFTEVEEDDDDVKRKATLKATGLIDGAAGEAEVEYTRDGQEGQESEFSARNLQPGATYSFVIDNQEVGTATASQRGRASMEVTLGAKSGA